MMCPSVFYPPPSPPPFPIAIAREGDPLWANGPRRWNASASYFVFLDGRIKENRDEPVEVEVQIVSGHDCPGRPLIVCDSCAAEQHELTKLLSGEMTNVLREARAALEDAYDPATEEVQELDPEATQLGRIDGADRSQATRAVSDGISRSLDGESD